MLEDSANKLYFKVMRFFSLFFLILLLATPALAQFDLRYYKADSMALAYHPHRFTSAKKIAHTLTEPFESEEEKARVLFRWVAENIRYDIREYIRLKMRNFRPKRTRFRNKEQKARWQRKQYRKLVQGTLFWRKAVCGGYAELYAYLCNQAGLQAQVIPGHSRSTEKHIGRVRRPLHAWNAVQIDGQWKLADVTWASGYVDEVLLRFLPYFRDHYFLTPPASFALNHYPTNQDHLFFLSDTFSIRDFYLMPVPLDGYFTQKLSLISPKKGYIKLATSSEQRIRFWSESPIMQAAVQQVLKKKVDGVEIIVGYVPIDFQLIELSPTYYEIYICPGERYTAPLLIMLNHQPSLLYQLSVKGKKRG